MLNKSGPFSSGGEMSLPAVRSFDLFDTLVARRCVEPQAVFRLMEQRSGIRQFAAKRISAEAEISGVSHVIEDIYKQLASRHGIDDETASKLMSLEIAIEEEMVFPILQHCMEFKPGDIVVSDMYLPAEFLRSILKYHCNVIPRSFILSSDGKRSGKTWRLLQDQVRVIEHVGDNQVTDIESARRSGIAARLTRVADRTSIEIELTACGYTPLAELIREARLRTWHHDEKLRSLQIYQIQLNFPLIFLATLQLLRSVKQNHWKRILFSARDCFLWHELYRALQFKVNGAPIAQYFLTSRVARAHPSPDYLEYCRALRADEPSVVVDVCGTGWSLNRLIESAPVPKTDVFFIHHIDVMDWRERYESYAPTLHRIIPHSIISRPPIEDDNEVLEELNRAPHAQVEDVQTTESGFRPVFTASIDEIKANRLLEIHHRAFREAIALIANLSREHVSDMESKDHKDMIERLYARMRGKLEDVDQLLDQKSYEASLFWSAMERKRLDSAPAFDG